MLSAETLVVFGCIVAVTFSIMGIQDFISQRTNASTMGLTVNTPVILQSPTLERISTPVPATRTKDPTISLTPIETTLPGRVIYLRSRLLGYKALRSLKESGWIVQNYIDGMNIEVNNSYVTITLAKSPVEDEEFKELAYEFIVLIAYETSVNMDWDVVGVKVISRDMADYTIAGFVEGHDNLAKMAENDYNRDLVEYEKYYE